MSRARERYICASEDRPHYNNEIDSFVRYRCPPPPPQVLSFVQENHITEVIKEEVPIDKLNELIDARIPQIAETIINEVGDTVVTTDNVDAAVDEIYGGSASDVLEEDDG